MKLCVEFRFKSYISHKKVAFYLLEEFNLTPDIRVTRPPKNTFYEEKFRSLQKDLFRVYQVILLKKINKDKLLIISW